MSRIDEQDELLLNRLLDGELPAGETAALRRRIESEPALRTAWSRLERINGLLRERRADTCAVDWRRFQASIMSEIEAEAAPARRVIRFPWWSRLAVPLAVAAAVALVLLVRAPYEQSKPGSEPGVIRVAYNVPRSSGTHEAGTLAVRFHRPVAGDIGSVAVTAAAEPIHVAYSRSSELEERIRREDTARDNQPSSRLYIMHADSRAPAVDASSELPPL